MFCHRHIILGRENLANVIANYFHFDVFRWINYTSINVMAKMAPFPQNVNIRKGKFQATPSFNYFTRYRNLTGHPFPWVSMG